MPMIFPLFSDGSALAATLPGSHHGPRVPGQSVVMEVGSAKGPGLERSGYHWDFRIGNSNSL